MATLSAASLLLGISSIAFAARLSRRRRAIRSSVDDQ
jgi:hypothetical protein